MHKELRLDKHILEELFDVKVVTLCLCPIYTFCLENESEFGPTNTVASGVSGLSSSVDEAEPEAVSNGDSCDDSDDCDDIGLKGHGDSWKFLLQNPNNSSLSSSYTSETPD